MTEYKQKIRQYTIQSAKQPVYSVRDGLGVFNLNACFAKPNNYARFESYIEECIQQGSKQINLCNLASFCYKAGLDYCSEETFKFVQTIVEIIRQHKIPVVQNNISSHGEVDMQPISSLISYDRLINMVYTNSILVDCLKIIGFADVQVRDVVEFTHDFRKVVPSDLIAELPIKSKKTMRAYDRILGLLND